MTCTKDGFTPVEKLDHMPQEQEIVEPEDLGQQVFAHMIRQLTNSFRPELDFD